MRYSENIAACRISPTAQTVVSRMRDAEIIKALSMNPHLDSEAANRLLSVGGAVKMRALEFATELDEVEAASRRGGLHATYAAKNKDLDRDALVRCLESSNKSVALSALTNPSTPVGSREAVPLERIEDMVCVGGSLANSVVRAFEVAANNRWLKSHIVECSNVLRRGITGLPDLSKEELDLIDSQRYSHWDSHRLNPARRGVDISTISTPDLSVAGSVACDYVAFGRQDFDMRCAELMLTRTTAVVEPHVLAAIVRKLGPAALSFASDLSVSRFGGAAWLVPVVGHSNESKHQIPWVDLQLAAEVLGENAEAWEIYAKMRHSWGGSALDLARACVCL